MHTIQRDCISVIVAIYNMSKYLDRCIQSILNQTYKNLEILLVNDGSIDNSREICEKYQKIDNRVKLYNKENGGISDTRNFGVSKVSGEYISFVDPDDWIEPTFYEKLLMLLKEKNADISCVGFDYVSENNQNIIHEKMKNIDLNSEKCLEKLCENRWFTSHTWNKLYRCEVFTGVEFPIGRNYEDVAVMHELIGNANLIACSSSILYHYFMRSESIIHVASAKNEMDTFYAYTRRLKAVSDRKRLKRKVLKCCAWACYNIIYISKNSFRGEDYRNVKEFWNQNKEIQYLGIKYYCMYRLPHIYKKIFVN